MGTRCASISLNREVIDRVVSLLNTSDLSQRKIATSCGVSQWTVSRVLAGQLPGWYDGRPRAERRKETSA